MNHANEIEIVTKYASYAVAGLSENQLTYFGAISEYFGLKMRHFSMIYRIKFHQNHLSDCFKMLSGGLTNCYKSSLLNNMSRYKSGVIRFING